MFVILSRSDSGGEESQTMA